MNKKEILKKIAAKEKLERDFGKEPKRLSQRSKIAAYKRFRKLF